MFRPGGPLSPGYPSEHAGVEAPAPALFGPERRPVGVLLANPALGMLGKLSARLEVAPAAAHAFFVEGSKLDIAVPGVDQRVQGYSVDLGYHLFPMGDGLRGFYIGPRGFYGAGSTDLARGTILGYGGDLGYQWVIGPIAINLGAGASRATATVEPEPAVLVGVPLQARAAVPARVEKTLVVPLATAGLGLAF